MGEKHLNRSSLAISIGGLRAEFICPSAHWANLLRKRYKPFLSTPKPTDLTVRISEMPSKSRRSGTLSVSTDDGSLSISRIDFSSVSSPRLDFTDLIIRRNRYSFDSWLRIFMTVQGLSRGALLVHSSGIRYEGKASVFPGRSGSGKSTMIRKLGKDAALSDELVLLRRSGKRVTASSTPFWGELKTGNGGNFTSLVRGFYYIKHGKKLLKTRLAKGESLRRFLACVLFFSKTPDDVGKMLALASSVSRGAPAYELSFALDTPKAELIKSLKG